MQLGNRTTRPIPFHTVHSLIQFQPILHFWFDELTAKQHFVKDAALDETIRARFGETLEAAARCELFAWRATAAGRLAEINQLGEAGADFAFESTLSSRTFAPFIRNLKAQGYAVAIYYFSLTNAQLAIRRVKLRVALGGHHVPSDVIKRRFGRSISNFFSLYAPLADQWAVFDNSTSVNALPVAKQIATELTVTEAATWRKLQNLSKLV